MAMMDEDYFLNKARQYCSIQERCLHDVAEKLREWKVNPAKAEAIVESLVSEDYLNEERFARLFAGGKFRINHWGKNKIIFELKKKKVPELIIQIGLGEIDDEEYLGTLKELLAKKSREIHESHPLKRKKKLTDFALQRGFHFSIVQKAIAEIG